jgi:hypothetical protein
LRFSWNDWHFLKTNLRYSNNITSLLIIIHIPIVSVTVTIQLKWLSFFKLIRESLTIEPHYWSGFTWLNTVTYHRSQILLYLHVQIKVNIFKFDNTFYCYFFMIFLFHYHVFECLRVKSISVFANLVSHFFYSNSHVQIKVNIFKFDNTFYCYFFMSFLFHYHVFECLRVKSISVFANLVSHFFLLKQSFCWQMYILQTFSWADFFPPAFWHHHICYKFEHSPHPDCHIVTKYNLLKQGVQCFSTEKNCFFVTFKSVPNQTLNCTSSIAEFLISFFWLISLSQWQH